MRRHEEKDAELDRRIVALRKKNQALLRRYQVSELRTLVTGYLQKAVYTAGSL